MSHAAFLAAIRETPDDDTPRLVYADWLEDQDDQHRAEFIRLQCRLARLDPDDLERQDLQERVWAMEREHSARWAAELPALPGIEWAICRRGFVEIIRARNYKALVEAAPRVRPATVLRGVVLSLVTGFKTFRDTECLAGLDSLNLLPKNGITPECLRSLAGCTHLAGLRQLFLSGHGITVEGARALAGSPHFASLRELTLSAVEAGTEVVRALVESPHLTRLSSLHLLCTNAGDAGIEALAGSATMANLEFLHLYGNGVTGAGLAALADSPHLGRLHSLSLDWNRLDAAAVARLVASPLSTGLRLLTLTGNHQVLEEAQGTSPDHRTCPRCVGSISNTAGSATAARSTSRPAHPSAG